MENNNNKDILMKCLKVAVFTGLGFWAAGMLGGLIGMIIAVSKA